MSDTPETDAAERMAYAQEYMVPTDFARKLERERDEARESLKHISEYGTDEINAAVELRQKLATALVERDEAREELHDIRLNLGEDADGYTLLHAVCVLQNERNEAMEDSLEQARLLGMGSEREAKLISDLEFRRGLYKVQEQYLETARRERDEAREKAERYRLDANAMMLQRDEAREELRAMARKALEGWQ